METKNESWTRLQLNDCVDRPNDEALFESMPCLIYVMFI